MLRQCRSRDVNLLREVGDCNFVSVHAALKELPTHRVSDSREQRVIRLAHEIVLGSAKLIVKPSPGILLSR